MQKFKEFPAIKIRNKSWEKSEYIPKWVDILEVDLDQFFTRPEIAESCWESFRKYLATENVNLSDYKFIDPSVGLGAFYNLLPKRNRIGIDVVKYNPNLIQKDFLS